jgi:hypothetical protein
MKKILCYFVIALTITGCSGILAIIQTPSNEEVKAANDINSPIAISAIFGYRDPTNGIDIHITYQNLDSIKTIKYAIFEIGIINAVGDFVSTTIRRKKITRLQGIGPVRPNSTSFAKWERAAYHPNANKLAIKSVEIIYMDGSTTSHSDLIKMPSSTGVIQSGR